MHFQLGRVFLLWALLTSFVAAQSSVTLWFTAEDLKDGSGNLLADDSLVLLLGNVATDSTAGVGFNATIPAGQLTIGSLLGSYQILGRAGTGGLADPGDVFGDTGSIQMGGTSFPYLSPGDQLAIAWFPTLQSFDSFAVTAGASYGLYTLDGSSDWRVPNTALTPFQVTAPTGLSADLTVSAIPEPTTYAALFGAGALCFAVYRRKRR